MVSLEAWEWLVIAMATNLFNIQANLQLNIVNFLRNVNTANTQGQNLANNLRQLATRAVEMGHTLAGWAKSAGIFTYKYGTMLVEAAADVQAENEAFTSTFKDNVGEAEKVLQRISETNNIYYTRLKKTGTEMYAQFRAAGAGADSMTMMERALNVAADAAAFYNITLEEASQRVRSFVRGNVEGGDAIGLFVTQFDRMHYAKVMYDKSWDDLNEAQRQNVLLTRAEHAYISSGAYQQASREADHYTNVLGNLNEKWRQIQATLGTPIIDAIGPVLDKFTKFLDENPEVIDKFAESIGVIASSIADLATVGIEWLGNNPEKLRSFGDFVLKQVKMLFGVESPFVVGKPGLTLSAEEIEKNIPALVDYIRAMDVLYDAENSGNLVDQSVAMTAKDTAWGKLERNQYDNINRLNEWLGILGITSYDSAWRSKDNKDVDITQLMATIQSLPEEIQRALSLAFTELNINVNIDGAGLSGAVDASMGIDNARGRYTTPAFSA